MGAELADAEVQPGQVLAGKYRVERVLGAGAMGVVVAAMHLELEERVALKFLAKSVVKDPDAIARFSREARAAAKIKSEHVARVSDVGRLANGSPYLVMEYLIGTDLDRVLSTSRQLLSIEATVRYVLQACEALAEAHAIGIVHRDLKPANLFIAKRRDGSDCLKVLDFGISKITRDKSKSDIALTQTTAVMGTPLYMSPEQMNSPRDATPRSDIWSLGAILYELLTRHPPFDAQTITQLAMMIVHDQPPPMATYRPDVPPRLEAVIRRCLEKDPKKRFADVAELTTVLAPFSPAQGQISAPRARMVLASLGHTEPLPTTPSTHEEHGAPTLNPSSSSIVRGGTQKLGAAGARSSAGKWVAISVGVATVAAGLSALIFFGGAARSTAVPLATEKAAAASAPSNTAPPVAAPIQVAPPEPTSTPEVPSAVAETAPADAASAKPNASAHAASTPIRPRIAPIAAPSPPPVRSEPPPNKGSLFNDRN